MELFQRAVRTSTTQQPSSLSELDDAPPPPATDKREAGRRASSDTQTHRQRQDAPKTTQNFELDKLPEDMLHHIHSLIPVQDAGRAACVSRRFLRSWRCYSNLTLNRHTLGLTRDRSEGSEIHLINKVDQIINNYSVNGMKVKTLDLDLWDCDGVSASCLDKWLRIAVKSGIQELSLSLSPSMKGGYCFPCSVLFDDEAAASSVESLKIYACTFHPIGTLGCFTRLKILHLCCVRITEEGLRQLLSKSSSLERLEIFSCNEIVCLKIPSTLQKLNFLLVASCPKIQVIEIGAPNLFAFRYYGFPPKIYIADSSQLTEVFLASLYPSGVLSYGRAKLPSIASNVQRLTLLSYGENVNTRVLPDKLLHLKGLEIQLNGPGAYSPDYDIFSLVSFLDASPALESFILRIERDDMIHHSDVGDDDACLRGESAYQHDRLKRVMIAGFCPDKSLIKLVIHVLESAPSLEHLTLDTAPRRYGMKIGDASTCATSREMGKCCWMSQRALKQADRAIEAASRHIVGRVPSTVEFMLLEPCRRCHTYNW